MWANGPVVDTRGIGQPYSHITPGFVTITVGPFKDAAVDAASHGKPTSRSRMQTPLQPPRPLAPLSPPVSGQATPSSPPLGAQVQICAAAAATSCIDRQHHSSPTDPTVMNLLVVPCCPLEPFFMSSCRPRLVHSWIVVPCCPLEPFFISSCRPRLVHSWIVRMSLFVVWCPPPPLESIDDHSMLYIATVRMSTYFRKYGLSSIEKLLWHHVMCCADELIALVWKQKSHKMSQCTP